MGSNGKALGWKGFDQQGNSKKGQPKPRHLQNTFDLRAMDAMRGAPCRKMFAVPVCEVITSLGRAPGVSNHAIERKSVLMEDDSRPATGQKLLKRNLADNPAIFRLGKLYNAAVSHINAMVRVKGTLHADVMAGQNDTRHETLLEVQSEQV